jgi:hypothetical protein
MKTICLGAMLLLCSLQILAQYKPQRSHSWVQDKDFYLFTLLEQPAVRGALTKDTLFTRELNNFRELLDSASRSRSRSPLVVARSFEWSDEDMEAVARELDAIWENAPLSANWLIGEMRRSGYWILDSAMRDTAMLNKAWLEAARSENKLIEHYTTNKGFRYPAVDSATFAPGSPIAIEQMGETLMMLWHEKDSMDLFFQPVLQLALDILLINNRDEPARFEPLDTANKRAYARIQTTDWNSYDYEAILIPGEGPENDWSMSPMGKYRCQLGAEAYRQKKAPFLIVSGGFVHPFQTPYCEADQMRDYLVKALGIPADAVIIEPQARHTTTNFRNANRIMLRKGFPQDKRVLCISTAGQMGYILAPFFANRCHQELGYVPFVDLQKIDPFTASYIPARASLQLDATDPLDP